jgi:hypothetical protein
VTRFRIDPELVEAAGLTDRQRQALEFYDGRNFGYRAVARELDIQLESARGLVRAGLAKIERATRPEQPAEPARRSGPQAIPGDRRGLSPGKPSKLNPDEPGASIKVFDF